MSIILTFIIFPFKTNAEEMVSVKLVNYIEDPSAISIVLSGDYVTLSPTLSLQKGVNYTLFVEKGELYLTGNNRTLKLPGDFTLIPNKYNENHLIYLNGRPYMGAMYFTVEKEQNIRPINQLPLEDYLKGVVPFEVYPTWEIETLKAQSLAARTYAYIHLKENRQMDDTIKFQVYGGYSSFDKTNNAVEQTKGQIITYKNKPINAFYSASNGGMTESNNNVWNGDRKEYYPIKTDPYDPGHPWEFSIHENQIDLEDLSFDPAQWLEMKERDQDKLSSIKQWLTNQGFKNNKIISIPYFQIGDEKTSGKRSVKGSITINFMYNLLGDIILFDQLSLEDVSLSQIRPMIGGTMFKSYYIDSLEKKDGFYTMKGRGYGHGVGMSQWGANEMAKTGKKYQEIIEFYFPGTSIKTLTDK
ncbi:SpoIID/LytB domain protein [Salirhabdus euzebyi]|uniref:SpoIID/LytB domain protein n=1 Tax=Salirhabdus euzebyi TaxID=394506 RepID=A0A841Q8T4_9BACI|nr:SpoIID/LytB domain-containing protein [Salirhabdus euzebyi]MBB6454806.1 SpoIID/LytB domain protein [Salirhabdus euzebyi]